MTELDQLRRLVEAHASKRCSIHGNKITCEVNDEGVFDHMTVDYAAILAAWERDREELEKFRAAQVARPISEIHEDHGYVLEAAKGAGLKEKNLGEMASLRSQLVEARRKSDAVLALLARALVRDESRFCWVLNERIVAMHPGLRSVISNEALTQPKDGE